MRHISLAVALCILLAVPLSAQTTVRVTRDQAIIWQPNFVTAATVVKVGTELDVVVRRGDWYEVVLPSPAGTKDTGMIAASQVEPVSGSRALDRPLPPTAPTPRSAPQPINPATRRRTPVSRGRTDSGFRGFGSVGYGRFQHHEGFDAILGQSGGLSYGGGAEYRANSGVFIQGYIEPFHKTGERVFVSNGQIFKLGIPDTVTLIPVALTGGYRFRHRGAAPYVGGGVGRYFYREDFAFADPSEKVTRQFTSYHILGGIEWQGSGWLGTAFEVQYTRVPDDLTNGVAQLFNEHDLGGVQARVKILVGK